MRLVWADPAVVKPFLDCLILFPGVIARQCLHWKHVCIVENFIFSLKNGKGLSGGLVFVNHVVIIV